MKGSLACSLLLAALAALTACVTAPPAVDPSGNVTIRTASPELQSQGLRLFDEYKKARKRSGNPGLGFVCHRAE